ncbi:hypothetical protein BKA65DRAFT_565679 [Rhexocercosporidium sp. MPI-PUGE-AT-0058]|nr:hypothetical protein BKA65DRAFT_565679 [Rhexocercosporidium sp. MPI-PUGE-AT-0058]
MKTSSILLAYSTLLASTLALPSASSYPTSPYPAWRITNFTEGCSPGGCIYSFAIASPSTPSPFNEPAFATICTGTNVAGKMQACGNPAISANEIPGPGKLTLLVQHEWTTKEGVTYFVKGNQTEEIGGYPKGFEVPETEVSAIA